MSTHPMPSRPAKLPRHVRRGGAAELAQPAHIVERQDGYCWMGDGHLGEFAAFESYELARIDRDAGVDAAGPTSEPVLDAERQIGMAEWIDEQTGAPAEGVCPPHLEAE